MRNIGQPTLTLMILLLIFFCSNGLSKSAIDYEKALASFNQESFDEAYIHLKNALQDNPSHLQSKLMMGNILLRRNQTLAAINEYQESLVLGADLNIAYFPLAKAYTRIGDYDKVVGLTTDNLNKDNKFGITLLQALAYENSELYKESQLKYEEAFELQPANIDAINNLASFHMRQGQLDKAQIFIVKAMYIDPNNANILHIQGQLKQEQGKLTEALEFFKLAHTKSPTEPFISRSLANTYVSLNNLNKAREIVDMMLLVTPDEPFIMLLSARIYSMDNNNELATKAYEEITQKLALIPNELLLKQEELLLISGLALYMTENYESARNKLINYVASNPESLYSLEILIDTYIRLGEPKVALKLLESRYELVRSSLPLSMVLCDLYLKTNKIHQCQNFISELRELHKAERVLDLLQVKTFQARKKYQEALAYFEAKFSNTRGFEVKKTAVILYLQNNQEVRALEIANELIALLPDNVNYQLLKSDVLISLKRFDEAQSINDKILETQSELFPAKFNRANLYYLKKEYQQAQFYAEKLLTEDSSSFRLHLLLANTLLAQNEFEKAKNAFNTAKLFDRENPIPYEKNIQIYMQLNDLKSAIKELNRLQKSHFLNPNYIQTRAEIYIQQNESDKAAEQYSKLYNIWSDDHQKLLYLGQQQRFAKINSGAEKSLLHALELAPNFLYAKIELMRLYISIGEIGKTEIILSKLPTDIQKKSNIQLILGDIALAKLQLNQAKFHYLAAIQLNNNYQAAIIKLYNLAKEKNIGIDEFLTTMQNIVNNYPDAHFQRHILADFLYFEGNAVEAKKHYLILDQVPGLLRVEYLYNNLANLLVDESPIIAITYIDKALKIDKNNSAFIDTKGWILTKQSQFIEGLDLLRESFAMDSSNPSVKYHIAYNLVKTGQLSEARLKLEKLVSSDREFAEKQRAKELLESI
jgi:putative PEP-CTERM system TPR-repeat lipoprotein